jgi:hypothetical protein
MLHLREALRSIECRHALDVLVHFGRRAREFLELDAALARIVAGYCESEVAVKKPYQRCQVRNAPTEVLFDHKAVAHAQAIGSLGHKLHQPHSAFGRYCVRVPTGLHLNDGLHQLDRHMVGSGVIRHPIGR